MSDNVSFLVAVKDTVYESVSYKAGDVLVNGADTPMVFESVAKAEQGLRAADDPSAWMISRHPSEKVLNEAGFTKK